MGLEGIQYHTEKSLLFFNGEFRSVNDFRISPFNQTLHYGYGIFEGIRAYNTQQGPHIFKVRRHFERMANAAVKLGIEMPYSVQDMINFSYQLIELNNLREAYIRPLLFMDKNQTLRAESKPNVMITCWKWKRYFDNNHLKILVSGIRRLHPKTIFIDCKVSGHYVNAILATKEALAKGYDEALMLDVEGYVAQGPAFSIFYEKDGRLYTPPLDKIFPGITRTTVIDLARQMGIEVIEKEFGVEDIISADGAFFTSTAAEVTGISSINDYKMRLDWEETIGHILHNKYKRIVSGKDTNFLEYF